MRPLRSLFAAMIMAALASNAIAVAEKNTTQTPLELWQDYDPNQGDFREEVVRAETKEGVYTRDSYISVYVVGEQIRVYCKYAVKAGAVNAPGLLNVHGWMATASSGSFQPCRQAPNGRMLHFTIGWPKELSWSVPSGRAEPPASSRSRAWRVSNVHYRGRLLNLAAGESGVQVVESGLKAGLPSFPLGDADLSQWVQPVPSQAVFELPDWCVWCGSCVRGDDGKYHLFYSRWPSKYGHNGWVIYSEVARAVSDSPTGPFRHVEVVLPARGAPYWDGACTHNPQIIRIGGKYCLYYMGNCGDPVSGERKDYWTHRNHQRIGLAVADSPAGPWRRLDRPVVDVSPESDAPDALVVNNPTVCARPEGGVLMVYKAVAAKGKLPFGGPVVHLVATAERPEGPFVKVRTPIFTRDGVLFAAEDPFIWHDGQRYRAIFKDMGGLFTKKGCSLAHFESKDGFDWQPAKHPFVTTTTILWTDGQPRRLNALERPQLLFDAKGIPIVLYCAGAYDKTRVPSFNVAIPLQSPK